MLGLLHDARGQHTNFLLRTGGNADRGAGLRAGWPRRPVLLLTFRGLAEVLAKGDPAPLQATTRAMDEYFAAERYAIGERVAVIFRWVFLVVLFLLADIGAYGVPGQRVLTNVLLALWAAMNVVVTLLLLRGVRAGRAFGLTTLIGDLLFSVALIYVTNGFSSPFFLAFFIAIIASAVRFGMLAGLASALAIAVMFLVTGGLAPVLEHPFDQFLPLETVGKVFLFLVVAIISGLVVRELDTERRLAITRAAEAEALHRMSIALASSLETDTVLRVILEQATALTEARSAALVAPGQEGPVTLLSVGAAGVDYPPLREAVKEGLEGESKLAPDGAWMVVPVGEKKAALLLVGEPGMLSREKYFRVSALAASATVTLDNALQYQQRAREAITDGLTGLLNTRELRRRLAAEQGHYTRLGKPFALLLIDLDHFKQVNDSLGHQHGDQILESVAEIVRRTIRAHDVAARYGGDELAVIALEAGSAEGSELAGRLLEAVRGAALPATPGHQVTLSIGVAACPDDATGDDELIMAADQALYLAKRQGRNRLATSSQLVSVFEQNAAALAEGLREAGPLVALATARALDRAHHRGSRHASRVAAAACQLAAKAGRSAEEMEFVRMVSLLHELPEEPSLGDPAELLQPRFPEPVLNAVVALKEAVGNGSREGHSSWPFEARVVALADRYDELVSGDSSGLGLAPAEALERIRQDGAGLDPELVAHLADLVPRRPLLHTDTVIAPAPRV